jgi:hypothetical protein
MPKPFQLKWWGAWHSLEWAAALSWLVVHAECSVPVGLENNDKKTVANVK